MTSKRTSRAVGAVVCAGLLWPTCVPSASADPSDFTIAIPGFGAPVGMAADTGGDRYWVTDGSAATTSTLVAVNSSGQKVASVGWQARPRDVQALAWSKGTLYVGDIGDPERNRDHVQVLSPTTLDAPQASWKAWDLVYPDGPHDAAAMAMSGRGNLYVITRGPSPGIYRAPSQLSRTGDNQLTRVADAPQGVTDATFLPDGARLTMRTDSMVHVVDAYTWRSLASSLIQPSGGQAITTDVTGKGLEISGSDARVLAAEIPTTMATATPTPTPTASPQADPRDTSTAKSRTGTLVALLGATALALVAAGVTALWGRRR